MAANSSEVSLSELEGELKRERLHPACVWQLRSGSSFGRSGDALERQKLRANGYELLYALSVSALHARHWELFHRVLKLLENFLGESKNVPRLKLLQGMKLEAEHRWNDAQKLYLDILELNGDPPSSARLVAILRSQLRNSEAILTLQRYIQDIPADKAAWQELRKLSCEMHDYDRAVFASCQCILLVPNCAYTAERAAEVYYSIEAYDLARNYYARSIHIALANVPGGVSVAKLPRLNNDNAGSSPEVNSENYQWTDVAKPIPSIPLSAVWGLWMSCTAIESATRPLSRENFNGPIG